MTVKVAVVALDVCQQTEILSTTRTRRFSGRYILVLIAGAVQF